MELSHNPLSYCVWVTSVLGAKKRQKISEQQIGIGKLSVCAVASMASDTARLADTKAALTHKGLQFYPL